MTDIAAKSVQVPALVYVRSNGRVWPQIWHEPVIDLDGYWRGRIVAVHPLRDVDFTKLRGPWVRALINLFPPPAEPKPASKIKVS